MLYVIVGKKKEGSGLCRVYNEDEKVFSFGSDGTKKYTKIVFGEKDNYRGYADNACSSQGDVVCEFVFKFYGEKDGPFCV